MLCRWTEGGHATGAIHQRAGSAEGRPPEAREGQAGPFPRAATGMALPTRKFRPLAPRAARQKAPVALGHLAFDILLQQPSTWLTEKNIGLPPF